MLFRRASHGVPTLPSNREQIGGSYTTYPSPEPPRALYPRLAPVRPTLRKDNSMIRIGALVAVSIAASIGAGALSARDIPGPGLPVSVVVTAAGQKSASAPQLTADDVLVSENKQHMPVTGLEPLRSQGGLQLWLLIDDGSATNLGTQLADLKKFVLAQHEFLEVCQLDRKSTRLNSSHLVISYAVF